MKPVTLSRTDPRYPAALIHTLGKGAPATLTALGNLDLLDGDLLALYCSIQCPGNLILQLYDLARTLRDQNIPVIGGFHTPMEKECLRLLLRGSQPIVICLARNLGTRQVLPEWRVALQDSRLLILSPFSASHTRITAESGVYRNRVVAALAATVFIAYAAPNGKTKALARETLLSGKSVLTFDDPGNMNLLTSGAKPQQFSPHQ